MSAGRPPAVLAAAGTTGLSDSNSLVLSSSAQLRFVPAAVLSAIILPDLLQPGGKLNLSLSNTRLLAGVLAMAVAWRTRSVVLTVGAAALIALIPLTLLAKLVALTSRPRINRVLYHGVLAPNAAW